MIDASKYSVEEMLKNGLRVTVRAIRPHDKEALLAAFQGLDERTIYLRFFAPKRTLTPRDLKEATDIDFVRTVALVTCLQDSAGGKIIGAGRYTVFGDAEPPDKAEVAFTVEEDYQGLGIASITMRHLVSIAKEKGIAQFHAEVLAENKGMLAVFDRTGMPVEKRCAEGVVHVTLSLAGETP